MEKAGAPAGPGRQRPRRVGFHDRDTVRHEDFAALLHDWEHAMRDAELGTQRGLARTVRHAAPMRRHAQARAPDSLRWANEKSIYRGPDGKRYITRAVPIGQQLLADTYAEGAPQLAYEKAAALLGVGHRWSNSPCHRGPDHALALRHHHRPAEQVGGVT
jgi:hypothetical protein